MHAHHPRSYNRTGIELAIRTQQQCRKTVDTLHRLQNTEESLRRTVFADLEAEKAKYRRPGEDADEDDNG